MEPLKVIYKENEILKDKLKDLMLEKHVTYDEIAYALGLSIDGVVDLKYTGTEYNMMLIRKLAGVLKCSPNDFLRHPVKNPYKHI